MVKRYSSYAIIIKQEGEETMIDQGKLLEPVQVEREDIRVRNICRYLQIKPRDLDKTTKELIEACILDLFSLARVKHYAQVDSIVFYGGGRMQIGPLSIESKVLASNLKGTRYVVSMGLTLGLEVDRWLYRLSKRRPSQAIIADACASEMVESVTRKFSLRTGREALKEGLLARPRFSPGFGDYGLENQRDFIQKLDLGRRIGIVLTRGDMMVPTKSVTALMGLEEK